MFDSLPESPIDFELAAGLPMAAVEQLWRELESRSDCEFFLSWDWIGCWIAAADRPFHIMIGRMQGRVVLLGLLIPSHRRSRIPAVAIPGASLQTTGQPDQDVITIEYNGFLVARDCREGSTDRAEDAAIRFLLTARAGSAWRIDELHLRNVARTYQGIGRLGGLHGELVWSKPSWRVDLDAIRASGRNYLDTISANTRQQIRRSMRLYEKQGPLVATRARDVPEALAFLEGLKDLHQPYWTGKGEPGAFAFPFFVEFQRRLIEACQPHGGVEMIRVTRGNTAIGYLYNLIYRRRVYSYQCGFLFEDDPRLKPGLVSHSLCIDMHEREGDSLYDFMAGDNRYKANLGTPGPQMHYVVVQRRSLPIRMEIGLRKLRDAVRGARRS